MTHVKPCHSWWFDGNVRSNKLQYKIVLIRTSGDCQDTRILLLANQSSLLFVDNPNPENWVDNQIVPVQPLFAPASTFRHLATHYNQDTLVWFDPTGSGLVQIVRGGIKAKNLTGKRLTTFYKYCSQQVSKRPPQ